MELDKELFVGLTLGLIFTLETFFPFMEPNPNRFQHGFKNLLLALINAAALSFFSSSVFLGLMEWVHTHQVGLLNSFSTSWMIQFALAFVLFDAWMYVWHRLNHQIPFLWRFHRTHHSDPFMDTTTALRFHFGEIFLSLLARLIIIPLLGIHWVPFLAYEFCLQPVILFHHSNLAVPESWDRVLRIFIVTPNMHRVHHSMKKSETNSNYASIFSFWDRLARTFKKHENPRQIQFGLLETLDEKWHSFWGLILTPYMK